MKFKETREWEKDGYKLTIEQGQKIKISHYEKARYNHADFYQVKLPPHIAIAFADLIKEHGNDMALVTK